MGKEQAIFNDSGLQVLAARKIALKVALPSILIAEHLFNFLLAPVFNFLLAPVAEKGSAVPSGLASHTENVDPLQVDVVDHDG